MKTNKNNLGYSEVVGYSLLTEFGLIVLQGLYILIHNFVSDTAIHFNPYFIKHTGFYVFLIIGFIAFILLSVLVLNKIEGEHPAKKLLTLFLSGSIMEILFYIIMMGSDYDGELLYSVLNKFLAIVFGAIIFRISDRKRMRNT